MQWCLKNACSPCSLWLNPDLRSKRHLSFTPGYRQTFIGLSTVCEWVNKPAWLSASVVIPSRVMIPEWQETKCQPFFPLSASWLLYEGVCPSLDGINNSNVVFNTNIEITGSFTGKFSYKGKFFKWMSEKCGLLIYFALLSQYFVEPSFFSLSTSFAQAETKLVSLEIIAKLKTEIENLPFTPNVG